MAFTESRHEPPAAPARRDGRGSTRGGECVVAGGPLRGGGRVLGRRRRAHAVVRVAVHNLQEVVGDFVEIGDRSQVERDDGPRALEHPDVPVHTHVLANLHTSARHGRILRVKPQLDVHHARAVVDRVLLLRRFDFDPYDLPEKSQVVHFLAVDFEGVIHAGRVDGRLELLHREGHQGFRATLAARATRSAVRSRGGTARGGGQET
eukprot:CAMPEP_0117632134 /NCGR_PEP_ID=MMETSP0802-20121206/4415_1 /TAXON_ID=38833 /ORGANISM="Micromonas sp., Strain CCMP2099" /LENGTH=205 /DNA_ID=CAMNT_0005436547 /DNA_START=263 /DNA_END=877 /DNA_ORIENTATION=+